MKKTQLEIRSLGSSSPAEYASICCESCSKICVLPSWKCCLTSTVLLQTETFISSMSNIFLIFQEYCPNRILHLRIQITFLLFKNRAEVWSSLHWDKTEQNNKWFCISLRFTKLGPISCIFTPLTPELLLPHARWLSCMQVHFISWSVTCFHPATYC